MIIYVLLLIFMGTFMAASYHAIINGYTWAMWLTGIDLFVLFALLLAMKMICY